MTKKILLLSANPINTRKLRIDEELREIQEGLRRSKQREHFSLESAPAVRYRDIRRQILDGEPNIVHFSGHGAGEEGLVFEDGLGQYKLVTGEALAGLFELFESVECVVLNACYSRAQAESIAKFIPYVIGMDRKIGDRAAIEFSIGFYDALGAGRDYESAFTFGRNAIALSGIEENLTPRLHHERELKPRKEERTGGIDRSRLRRTLISLIMADFNEILFVLDVPAGMIPPSNTEQSDRVDKLLNWAKSPTGCGLKRVQEVLDDILNPR